LANSPPGILSRFGINGDVMVAAAFMVVMAIMVVPIPAALLDLFIATSIATALLTFLVSIYVRDPVEFSAFPIVLLGTTLFRLALNVATTRQILLHGQDGADAAGGIVMTFGKVLVGGDPIVGLVVFVILVIINFIVITKGAGRVAEVSARFTLDAMPGKQMAVDAELNSGLIDEKQARSRRMAIAREADFYGAMDGASKFIRGDAVAGILITTINIVGGLLVGMFQHDLPMSTAVEYYTVLTIGDGLVGQVPALVTSAAAGLLVTRVPDPKAAGVAAQLEHQVFGNPKVLGVLAASLFCFVIIPGLRVPFAAMGSVAAGAALFARRSQQESEAHLDAEPEKSEPGAEPPVDALLQVEPLAIEVGVELIGLVDERRGGDLVGRIKRIRRQIATDLGVVTPAIHLTDNLELKAGQYRILLRGEVIGSGEVMAHQVMAIDPGDAKENPRGLETVDPVFGLKAWWIRESERLRAQAIGYTVVDPPTIITTHLTELLRQYAHEILGRKQLVEVIDRVAEANPRLISDLVPDSLSHGTIHRVFRNLLREGVSVRDAELIIESMADYVPKVQNPDVLTEFVRQRLSRQITRLHTHEGAVRYIGFSAHAERLLTDALKSAENGSISLSLAPDLAHRLVVELRTAWLRHRSQNPVLLCPALARGPLRRLIEKAIPDLPVLSSAELTPTVDLQRLDVISLQNANRA
jgi:flagellar biosynthesis protein FlhA